jgi:Methylamine utilisation protein MauE
MWQALLAVIFAAAGLSKLAARRQFLSTLYAFSWLPASVARLLSRVVPLLELTLAATVLIEPTIGASVIAAVLVLFSGVTAQQLIAGRRFSCNCFGGAGTANAGYWTIGRNSLLFTASIAALTVPTALAAPAALTGAGIALIALLAESGVETLKGRSA